MYEIVILQNCECYKILQRVQKLHKNIRGSAEKLLNKSFCQFLYRDCQESLTCSKRKNFVGSPKHQYFIKAILQQVSLTSIVPFFLYLKNHKFFKHFNQQQRSQQFYSEHRLSQSILMSCVYGTPCGSQKKEI